MKRDTSHGIIVAAAALAGLLTAVRPSAMADNSFLASFVSHEIMAFMIVVLTITTASVANIHLSISRLLSSIKDEKKRQRVEAVAAKPLRADIESSARLLFWAFGACSVALLLKGAYPQNSYVVSVAHGTGVVVTLINLLVLLDIYKTVCKLASSPVAGGAESGQ